MICHAISYSEGPDHPDTLGTVQNLANIYRDKGRYDDAEELYKRALAGREEQLGPDHPDTLRTVNNFTIFLRDRGRVDDTDLLLTRFGLECNNGDSSS